MGTRRTHLREERGETLVEMLVALSILGLAAVAILAGLQLSVTASDMHRKQTTGSASARSYAEAIQTYVADGHYVPCAAAGTYAPATVGFTDLPAGYTATHAPATPLTGDGGTATCPTDTGVQRVEVTVTSTDARAAERLTVLLRKPCDDPTTAACT